MRTWIVGDSMVSRAGSSNLQLRGAGSVTWVGQGGARCNGVANRISRCLRSNPYPTTVIIHLGTNDIFHDKTWNIKKKVKENLSAVRNLLPNARLIWSDILVRLMYADEINDGAGKRNMRTINKRAHKIMREQLPGDNKVIVHSGIFQAGRRRVGNQQLFEYDCTHPTAFGLQLLRNNWSDALLYFNRNPQASAYPPGSIRLQ